jgi:hypothetical protein
MDVNRDRMGFLLSEHDAGSTRGPCGSVRSRAVAVGYRLDQALVDPLSPWGSAAPLAD